MRRRYESKNGIAAAWRSSVGYRASFAGLVMLVIGVLWLLSELVARLLSVLASVL
jgi:hypothetical protein